MSDHRMGRHQTAGCPYPRIRLRGIELATQLHLQLQLQPDLILPSFGQVPHPLGGLVRALLVDLQEAHLHTRAGVHRDLEVHTDRGLHPHLLPHGWQ